MEGLVTPDINKMIELERTFLAKEIPKGLQNCEFKEMLDIYFPKSKAHPTLRIRKNGDKYELTKKEPLEDDPSHMKEETIHLTEEEFNELESSMEGKRVHKNRYFYDYNGMTAEIDVFQDDLLGLIVVDFEFDSVEDKNAFQMPGFCLADVTFEDFIAGGMICGKSYEDVQSHLDKFNYKKLFLG